MVFTVNQNPRLQIGAAQIGSHKFSALSFQLLINYLYIS